jgi:hypothetical protein
VPLRAASRLSGGPAISGGRLAVATPVAYMRLARRSGSATGVAEGNDGRIMANERVSRFLGGSPLRVLVQLILLSLLVGVVMAALGLEPLDLVAWIVRAAERIVDMGFGAVEQVLRYLLLGAVVVIPVWLVLRLLNAGRG